MKTVINIVPFETTVLYFIPRKYIVEKKYIGIGKEKISK